MPESELLIDSLALFDGDLRHRDNQISRKVIELQAGVHDTQMLPGQHISVNLQESVKMEVDTRTRRLWYESGRRSA